MAVSETHVSVWRYCKRVVSYAGRAGSAGTPNRFESGRVLERSGLLVPVFGPRCDARRRSGSHPGNEPRRPESSVTPSRRRVRRRRERRQSAEAGSVTRRRAHESRGGRANDPVRISERVLPHIHTLNYIIWKMRLRLDVRAVPPGTTRVASVRRAKRHRRWVGGASLVGDASTGGGR